MELIFWSYANLAMAQDGVERHIDKYDRLSFMIRARLYKGLTSGKMQIHSLFDDEKYKIANGAKCVYCGSMDNLSVDHIIPRKAGGSDSSDNLVCCCKACNSSKGDRNMMNWFTAKELFPPLLVLRRYLKLEFQYFDEKNLLGEEISSFDWSATPYSAKDIPVDYPHPSFLKL